MSSHVSLKRQSSRSDSSSDSSSNSRRALLAALTPSEGANPFTGLEDHSSPFSCTMVSVPAFWQDTVACEPDYKETKTMRKNFSKILSK